MGEQRCGPSHLTLNHLQATRTSRFQEVSTFTNKLLRCFNSIMKLFFAIMNNYSNNNIDYIWQSSLSRISPTIYLTFVGKNSFIKKNDCNLRSLNIFLWYSHSHELHNFSIHLFYYWYFLIYLLNYVFYLIAYYKSLRDSNWRENDYNWAGFYSN